MAHEVLDRVPPPRWDQAAEDGAASPRPNWSRYGPAALIAASFLPLLLLFAKGLWARPNYQFFPLLLPGAAVLWWRSCRHLGALEPARGASRAAAALGWALLAFGIAVVTPWFAVVGALVALLGAALALGGYRLARAALPGWALLWLAVPPPRSFDTTLITRLQAVASHWSSQLLDMLGVYHVMDGNVVMVGGKELLVDQACSGVYSLMTLLAGTVFYVLWAKVPPVRAAVLLVAAIFWVLFGNVLRIVSVVLLTGLGIEAASGWRHELLGLASFAIMLGLVFSTDRLAAFVGSVLAVARLRISGEGRQRLQQERRAKSKDALAGEAPWLPGGLAPASRPRRDASAAKEKVGATALEHELPPEPAAEATIANPTVPVDPRRTWLGSWPVAAAFAVLLLPQPFMPGSGVDEILSGNVLPARFAPLKADFLPEQLGAYQRTGFNASEREWDNSWGEHSRAWGYRDARHLASVSLDYSFFAWHDLTVCYVSNGWEKTATWVEPGAPVAPGAKSDGFVGGPRVIAEFRNSQGLHGYLVYALYDRHGRVLTVPGTLGTLGTFRMRLRSWIDREQPMGRAGEVLSYQLQVFTISETKPTAQEQAAIKGVFEAARERVSRLNREAAGGKKS